MTLYLEHSRNKQMWVLLLSKLNRSKVPPSPHHPTYSLMVSYRTNFISLLQRCTSELIQPTPVFTSHFLVHSSRQPGSLSDLERTGTVLYFLICFVLASISRKPPFCFSSPDRWTSRQSPGNTQIHSPPMNPFWFPQEPALLPRSPQGLTSLTVTNCVLVLVSQIISYVSWMTGTLLKPFLFSWSCTLPWYLWNISFVLKIKSGKVNLTLKKKIFMLECFFDAYKKAHLALLLDMIKAWIFTTFDRLN